MDQETGSEELFDLRQDAEAQADAATDVAAAAVAFNNAALPPNMPEWQKDAIRAKAAEIAEAIRDDESRLLDAKQREEEAQDNQASMVQVMAERQEREREEWMRTKSTVAGVTMTGREWAELAQRIHDNEAFRKKLIEAFQRHGATREEAEERADRVERVAQAAATPPSQRTHEQKKMIEAANADAGLSADLQTAKALIADDASPRRSPDSLSGKFDAATLPPAETPAVQPASPRPVTMTMEMGF